MFDPNKPVRTRDGRPARIKATDLRHRFGRTIVAIVEENGYEEVRTYAPNGKYNQTGDSGNSGHDLVNVPEKRMVTVAIVAGPKWDTFSENWEAFAIRPLHDLKAIKSDPRTIAVKEVEVVEGEGLEQSEGM